MQPRRRHSMLAYTASCTACCAYGGHRSRPTFFAAALLASSMSSSSLAVLSYCAALTADSRRDRSASRACSASLAGWGWRQGRGGGGVIHDVCGVGGEGGDRGAAVWQHEPAQRAYWERWILGGGGGDGGVGGGGKGWRSCVGGGSKDVPVYHHSAHAATTVL